MLVTEAIKPTPERIKRAGGLYDSGANRERAAKQKSERRQSIHDQNAVDALGYRDILAPREYDAASMFLADMQIASIAPRATASWETPVDGAGKAVEPSFTAAAASMRLEKARASLGRSQLRVLDFAFRSEPFEYVAKLMTGRTDKKTAKASATDLIRAALSDLADHYGIG